LEQGLAADRASHLYGAGKGTGETGKERINTGALLRRLLRYLTPFRLPLIGALGLVVITALVQAAGPAVIARAIDVNIAGKDLRGLTLSMLLLLGIYIIGLLAQAGHGYLIGTVRQEVLAQLRAHIFDKVQTLPLAFFDQNKPANLISRLVNDIHPLNQFLTH